jgi:hypothetical protein
MRKGRIARTDSEAFELVLRRLEADVGGLLQLWRRAYSRGQSLTPFWAFARTLFPIAEAIGDLIYRNDSTVKNLISVLENEFDNVRAGYKGKANVIALMYRHSLTHTDEMRSLRFGRKTVNWLLSLDQPGDHLALRKLGGGRRELRFDLTAFHEDLRRVCSEARGRKWGRKVAQRYNDWLLLSLNTRKLNRNEAAAAAEIGSF